MLLIVKCTTLIKCTMFSWDSLSCVPCISMDFFSIVLKWIEQHNLYLFFSKKLNEEELRCAHSMQNRYLKYHWNCCDYNPTFSLQIFIFPNPEGVVCVCISILLWVRAAPRPSWDVSAHSWMCTRIRPGKGHMAPCVFHSREAQCGHALPQFHLEYSSTDKEVLGYWRKQQWTFQTQSMIGLCAPWPHGYYFA